MGGPGGVSVPSSGTGSISHHQITQLEHYLSLGDLIDLYDEKHGRK